ncbi:MAG: hypothetical protein AAGA30_01230, partial [Planctomycetota bacterium]
SNPWIHKLLVQAIEAGVTEDNPEALKKSFEKIAKETAPSATRSARNKTRRPFSKNRNGRSRKLRR